MSAWLRFICRLLGVGGALALLAAPAGAFDVRKSASQLLHRSWTARDGLSGPLRSIAQTADGYLWLGTQAGLYRFDGQRFVLLDTWAGEAFLTQAVVGLQADRQGALWVAFANGAVRVLEAQRLVVRDLPLPGVRALLEDADGTIWAGGSLGLWRFRDGRWQPVGAESGYLAPAMQNMCVDRAGTVWIATDGHNFGLSGADLVHVNTIVKFPRGAEKCEPTGEVVGFVAGLLAAPDGTVWCAQGEPFVRRLGNSGASGANVLVGAPSSSLGMDAGGVLWVGTQSGTIVRLREPGRREAASEDRLTASDGLTRGIVVCWFRDLEGNLWAGTETGLERFSESKVTSLSVREGLFVDHGLILAAIASGDVWAAAFSGPGLQAVSASDRRVVTLPPYPPDDTSRIIALTAEGEGLWLGGSFGIARLEGGRVTFERTPGLEPGATVEAVAADRTGRLWASVWGQDRVGRIVRRAPGAEWQPVAPGDLPKSRCRLIWREAGGAMWLAFADGRLARFEHENFRVFGPADGLPGATIMALVEDADGTIWLGSGAGLSRHHNGRFQAVPNLPARLGTSLAGLVDDRAGRLWLAGARGLFRVAPAELQRALTEPGWAPRGLLLDELDGLRGGPNQGGQPTTTARSADGRLWFSTRLGLTMLDPENLPSNPLPPTVLVEELTVDDQPRRLGGTLELPPHAGTVEIRYTATSLTESERIRFRYRLEGYDQEWHGPTAARTVRYTNLPPRHYRFRVLASNNDGVWNESGATLAFHLAPAFYQTRWFLAGSIATGGLIALGLSRYRLRRVTRHNAELRRSAEALRASEQVARGQAEALVQSLDVLATSPEPELLIHQILATMRRLLAAEEIAAWRRSSDGTYEPISLAGLPGEGHCLAEAQALVAELQRTRAAVPCADAATDPRVSPAMRQFLARRGLGSFLLVPMLAGGEVEGIIGLFRVPGRVCRPSEIELAQALAHQAMLALQLTEFAGKSREAAVLDERNRLARDIHDTLAQGFTGVILQLDALEAAIHGGDSAEAARHLQRATELARHSLTEARRSVRALRPLALQRASFPEALRRSLQEAVAGTGLQLVWQLRGEPWELPSAAQDNLLRIGQESLTNALKHAEATTFFATLDFGPEAVRLELRDDGRGFAESAPHDGFGLAGMRERAEQMGARLSMLSTLQQGTAIDVVLRREPEALS